MKVLVTGAAGMIGTSLCESLAKSNINFLGIDLQLPQYSDMDLNYFKQIDCRKLNELLLLDSDFDMVIHLAAHSSVLPLIQSPNLALENISMTLNILEFCKIKNIKHVIFSSSREVYGSKKNYFFKEEDINITQIENPYGVSKLSCESLIASYSKNFNLNATICRFSNVYGKYDFTGRVIPIFIEKCLHNAPLTIFGKEKILDFIYIIDVVNALEFLMHYTQKTQIEIFNIMSNQPINLSEIATILKEKTNSISEINIQENRQGETSCFTGDNTKFLSLNPNFQLSNLDASLSSTIQWYAPYF